MAYVYSSSNISVPVGKVADYNNTNASRAIKLYRMGFATKPNFGAKYLPETSQNDFAKLIYGNGPYNLNHPKVSSNTLAKATDYLA
jgi:hypothetical protein